MIFAELLIKLQILQIKIILKTYLFISSLIAFIQQLSQFLFFKRALSWKNSIASLTVFESHHFEISSEILFI